MEQCGAVWKAPPVGVVKVNVDGAFHYTTRRGGLGFVFRAENGLMLGGGAWPLSGLTSPEHAEILACKAALEFAEVHGFGPVILEIDALEVQRQLSLLDSVNLSGLGKIYDDVVALLEAQSVIQVTHVGRRGNGVAHLLANHACSISQNVFYFSAPEFLQAAIAADLCTM